VATTSAVIGGAERRPVLLRDGRSSGKGGRNERENRAGARVWDGAAHAGAVLRGELGLVEERSLI
jgi:hypothetical protein